MCARCGDVATCSRPLAERVDGRLEDRAGILAVAGVGGEVGHRFWAASCGLVPQQAVAVHRISARAHASPIDARSSGYIEEGGARLATQSVFGVAALGGMWHARQSCLSSPPQRSTPQESAPSRHTDHCTFLAPSGPLLDAVVVSLALVRRPASCSPRAADPFAEVR